MSSQQLATCKFADDFTVLLFVISVRDTTNDPAVAVVKGPTTTEFFVPSEWKPTIEAGTDPTMTVSSDKIRILEEVNDIFSKMFLTFC